ncbi:baseplate J/gp47 family protein [Marilutibacter maris]|uniref:hypothetical protein n=1 Tax=Marilutibacter maris TaxID=1605891 RepID=UPI0011AE804C|nr:hypothetical protein [Lysobacter maris]
MTMPIELPDLDDIDYDELISGAVAALPGYGSDWTDYNPSDPGIAVLEMLAWLTEMLVYRSNRIQPESYRAFLQLLTGYGESVLRDLQAVSGDEAALAGPHDPSAGEPLQTVREVLQLLRRRYRAVTVTDYERLALLAFPQTHAADAIASADGGSIARLVCLPEVNAAAGGGEAAPEAQPGAISLVVLPQATDSAPWSQPSADLADALSAFFEDRRIVTTTVCVAGPRFVALQVAATLYIDSDFRAPEVLERARRVLFEYLHPLHGGADRGGWPFGRTVRGSDLTVRLAAVPGVAFVEGASVNGGDSVVLADDQLPQMAPSDFDPTAMVLQGVLGQQGSQWVAWMPDTEAE